MIRIGMVGAGGIALSHAAAIKKNQDCKLTAVADINRERADALAAQFGALSFTDYKAMDCEKMDAVILNLPHYLHCEVSVYFLEKGVSVLCEKPMACTLEECDEMIAAAKKSGKHLAIGHVQKYYTAVKEIKSIIENKTYGDLTMITESRCKDYLKNRAKWFLDKRTAGGGIAMNLGAHSIDRILYTTGLCVEEVHALTANPISGDDVEINAQLLLKLSGGVSATVSLCGTHVPKEEHETVYYFTDGIVKMRGDKLLVFENGEFVEKCEGYPLIERQLAEFLKLLRGEESEICTPEYGREIIRILKEVI